MWVQGQRRKTGDPWKEMPFTHFPTLSTPDSGHVVCLPGTSEHIELCCLSGISYLPSWTRTNSEWSSCVVSSYMAWLTSNWDTSKVRWLQLTEAFPCSTLSFCRSYYQVYMNCLVSWIRFNWDEKGQRLLRKNNLGSNTIGFPNILNQISETVSHRFRVFSFIQPNKNYQYLFYSCGQWPSNFLAERALSTDLKPRWFPLLPSLNQNKTSNQEATSFIPVWNTHRFPLLYFFLL